MMTPTWLINGWQQKAKWLVLLAPIAWLYALLATINTHLQKRHAIRLDKCVIVVGNITLGGSGKTTLVKWLAEQLNQQGNTVAIISKGYGRTNRLPEPTLATTDAACFGDEPAMLASQLPQVAVWVCDNRLAAIMHITADYLICDDGLQDYRFSPRIEIALIDGSIGFANGKRFPWGILREPKARLKKCDLVIQQGGTKLTTPAQGSFTLTISGFTNLLTGEHKSLTQAQHEWSNQSLHLCCGLANNQRVFQQFDALRFTTTKHPFPDHHTFTPTDIAHSGYILLTAKDAIKCTAFVHSNCWRIETKLRMPTELDTQLMRIIGSKATPRK